MSRHSLLLALTLTWATAFLLPLPAQELTDKQRNLAGRFSQLEQILLRLAETSGSSNPRQTALLKKALLESRDKLLAHRFETLVNTIERRQFSEAVTGQTAIEQDLLLLLQLLESVDREESREREKEAVQEFLRDLEEILHNERVLRHETQQQETQNLPALEQTQRDIRMQAQALQERIAEHEGTAPQRESEPNDNDDNGSDSSETQDGQQEEGQQPEEPQQEGQHQEGQQQEGQQQQEEQEERQQQQQQQSPTQQAMQRALDQMREAEQQLQQAQRESAVEAQEEAIAELQRLKEELERILRQIREEELMQTLEKLEARFQRMIQQEQGIRAQTERLMNEIAGERAPEERQIKIRADRLSMEQQGVIDDAEAALVILREDGTAQAMAESLLQARFDMTDVKKRLEQTQIDTITLHITDAVIEALQEMLDAVRAAIEEARERQDDADNGENREQGQGAEGQMQEEPLIHLLAELRMIRSMQRRVNDRTLRYDDEIKRALENPDTDLTPFRQAVEELARQQNRIARILHEIRVGRIE